MKYLGGLSLIELLFSLSILSLLGLGVIGWVNFYQQKQLDLRYGEMARILRFSRILALQKGISLTINPMMDKNWALGMRLFEDNASHQYSGKETIWGEWSWPTSGIQVIWKGFQSSDYLIFSPFIRQLSVNGTFVIQNLQGHQKKIIINRLGAFNE